MKLILFSLMLSSLSSVALATNSTIFNFSTKSIYYKQECTQTKGSVSSFKSKDITYPQKKCTLVVSKKSNRKEVLCQVTVTDKKDIFISGDKRKMTCTLRADRLPKEF